MLRVGRATNKTPVVGAVERGGRVKARKVEKEEMTSADMERIVRAMMDCPATVLTTDEYPGYSSLNNIVMHRRISHADGYSRRDLFSGQYGAIHTNTIEGFWAILKRAVYGQFHHVSKKYMHLYLNELTFRYNNRNNINAMSPYFLTFRPQPSFSAAGEHCPRTGCKHPLRCIAARSGTALISCRNWRGVAHRKYQS